MIDHHTCLPLNNYRIRDASSRTIFSATYTASIFQTKRYCLGDRPHSIPCLVRAGSLNPYGIPEARPSSSCMASDPLTLRLLRVPQARGQSEKQRCSVARKVRRFRQNGRPVGKFNNREEIIRPEIRGDVVVSLARQRAGRRVAPRNLQPGPPPQ